MATTVNGLPDAFFRRILDLLKEEGVLGTLPNDPVIRFKHPSVLQETLSLDINTPVESEEELLNLCRNVMHYSVKTNHPHFHNQLYGGVDPYGLAGAWITDSLNTNQYTFEVGPVFTLVEHAVLQHILELVGFPEGDGIFSPGGSMSNMYAMVLARYKAVPDIKTKGLFHEPPLVAFASEDAHYSVLKASHWLGIGTDNMVTVKTDEMGRMDPSDLEQCIKKAKEHGKKPFFVNAMAGTTVLGAFDPLEKLVDICEKHRLWLHVDACWGGTLMLSRKHCGILKSLYRTDSVSWNPHKMLGAPLQCSALVIKEKGLLHHCNAASATYLFQQDKFYDVSYDTGDKSVQCGRKVDAFKLWLMWKARGDNGFELLVDNAIACARYFKEKISNRPGFRLVIPEFECTNICFWFIPPSLREKTEDGEWWHKIHCVAPKLKERLAYSGTLMISYQPLTHRNICNFFRLVTTCHPPPSYEDMDFVIKEIETHGCDL